MSLLTEASLIVTPNAYNVGKLYSVIPNTTLGDMDVSRGSSATRVNSAGNIEIARTNLVLYSEQFDNAIWNKGTGGSISPNSVISPIGTLTADAYTWATSTASFAYLSQVVSAISQNSNTFSIWLKRPLGSGSRTIRLIISDVTLSTVNSSTFTVTETWQRFEFTRASANTTGSVGVGLIFGGSGTPIAGGEILDVWGAQLEQSSAATEYIPTTTSIRTKFAGITQDGGFGSNIPRIDYPPLGGCPSVLVEPARTNFFLRSEEFNLIWFTNSANLTTNTTTAPDGNVTADKLVATNLNDTHYVAQIAAGSVNSTTVTASVFVKAAGLSNIQLANNASVGGVANYILSGSGTATLVTGVSASIQAYNNGWYRCIMTFTPTTTGTFNIQIRLADSSGSISFTGDDVNGVSLWGAQVEAGLNATSYIPTVASTVTRTADSFTLNNIYTNGLLSASGGTWFVDLRNNIPLTRDVASVGLNLDVSFGNNGFAIRNNASAQRLTISKYISNARSDLYLTTTNTCKIAIKWNGTTADIFENGTKVVSATPFTPTAMQVINGISTDVSKNINQMSLWATPLTDDQCILLTGTSFSSYPEMASALIYTLQ